MIAASPRVERSEVIHAFAKAARAHYRDRLAGVYLLPEDPYAEQVPSREEQERLIHFGLLLRGVERGVDLARDLADLVSDVEARFNHVYALTVAVADADEQARRLQPALVEQGVLL